MIGHVYHGIDVKKEFPSPTQGIASCWDIFKVDKMVQSLPPENFYVDSLPRPWIYGDVKYNAERIDLSPYPSTLLLSWVNEMHWSMGGLSSKRKQMQVNIEGSTKKLRAIKELEEEAEALTVLEVFLDSKSKTTCATTTDEGIIRYGMETNEKPSEKVSSSV